LNIDFLDAVTLAVNLAENMRLERSFLRHRPEAATYENMLANVFAAFLPLFTRSDGRKIARGVEVFDMFRRWRCAQAGLDRKNKQ